MKEGKEEVRFGNIEGPVEELPLQGQEPKPHLREYGSLIVRGVTKADFAFLCPEAPDGKPEENEAYIRDNFARLNQYGIAYDLEIAPTTRAIGTSAPQDVLMLSCRRIEPLDLADTEQKLVRLEKFVALTENLLRYATETLEQTSAPLLLDIPREDQFIYGKLHSDAEADFILVDVDPVLSRRTREVERYFEYLIGLTEKELILQRSGVLDLNPPLRSRLQAVNDAAELQRDKYKRMYYSGTLRV